MLLDVRAISAMGAHQSLVEFTNDGNGNEPERARVGATLATRES